MSIPTLDSFFDNSPKIKKTNGDSSRFNVNGYIGSEIHRESARISIEKSRAKSIETKRDKHNQVLGDYDSKPNQCTFCSQKLHYSQRKNRFCSHTCAASLTNIERNSAKTEKRTIHDPLIFSPFSISTFGYTVKRTHIKSCIHCKKTFRDPERKTCSDECFYDFKLSVKKKKFMNFSVSDSNNCLCTLQSSWEIEIFNYLNEKKIYWIRPKAIPWIDQKGKSRSYMADFYLPDYNIYLDPKNKWLVEVRDKEKLSCVSKVIKLFYGEVDYLKEVIDNL